MAFAFLLSGQKPNKILFRECTQFGYGLDMFDLNLLGSGLRFRKMALLHRVLFRIIPAFTRIREVSCLNAIKLPAVAFSASVSGFFQDGRAFIPYRERLIDFFRIRDEIRLLFEKKYESIISGKKILAVSIRIGNYKKAYFEEIKNHGLLPMEWYLNAIDTVDKGAFDTMVILSDDFEEVLKDERLKKYNPVFITDSPEFQFQMMTNADVLIISNSSFSWWGAFLNKKENTKVIAPMNWVGYHAGVEYPYGIMIPDWEWVS